MDIFFEINKCTFLIVFIYNSNFNFFFKNQKKAKSRVGDFPERIKNKIKIMIGNVSQAETVNNKNQNSIGIVRIVDFWLIENFLTVIRNFDREQKFFPLIIIFLLMIKIAIGSHGSHTIFIFKNKYLVYFYSIKMLIFIRTQKFGHKCKSSI